MSKYIHSGSFKDAVQAIKDNFGEHYSNGCYFVDENHSFGLQNGKTPFLIGNSSLPNYNTGSGFSYWHWVISKNKKAMAIWANTTEPLESSSAFYAAAVLAKDAKDIWHIFYYGTINSRLSESEINANAPRKGRYYYNTPSLDYIITDIYPMPGHANEPNILRPCYDINGEAFGELLKVDYTNIYNSGSPAVLTNGNNKYLCIPFPFCYSDNITNPLNTTAYAILVE